MTGRCARHPDANGAHTCTRCGDFFCEGCLDPVHPTVCARCAERLPHGIAWEDPRAGWLGWRFVLTLRDVLLRPRVAFPGPARPLPAFGFAALCGAILGGLFLVFATVLFAENLDMVQPVLDGLGAAGVVLLGFMGLFLWVGLLLGAALVQTASFAVGLRIAGRTRGLLRFAGRASGYAQGLVLLGLLGPLALALADTVEDGAFETARSAAWLATAFVWPTLSGRVWFAAAKGLGLPSTRAALAASWPTVACTLPAAYMSWYELRQLGM